MASWSDAEFCKRVVRRCDDLGKSQREVLRGAGLAHDYLTNPPAHGRRLDRIVKLAEALDWSLAEIMGLSLTVKGDVKLFTTALLTARKATVNVRPLKDETLARVQTTIYNMLVQRRAEGLAVDDDVFLTSLAAFCAENEAILQDSAA
jgi:hypothetical protein